MCLVEDVSTLLLTAALVMHVRPENVLWECAQRQQLTATTTILALSTLATQFLAVLTCQWPALLLLHAKHRAVLLDNV